MEISCSHILLIAFQKQLRELMITEQVRIPSLKKKDFFPACATQQEVTSFCDDRSCRPNQDRIIMAWFEPLTSEWNTECIALLALKAKSAFQASITASTSPQFPKDWLSIDTLCKQIARTLKPTKDAMTPRIQSASIPNTSRSPSSAAAKARRRPRKVKVQLIFSMN